MKLFILLVITHAVAALAGLLFGQNNPRIAAATKKVAAAAEAAAKKAAGK